MQFYFQGEPLLNTHLPEMISLAHQTGLYTIVSTNAQALTQEMAEALVKSGLNRIIVSIDGGITYSEKRDFNIIMDTIKGFAADHDITGNRWSLLGD
jgi:MoaA/NifB/PqqE/SkfB family radical SAM enzyme